VSTFNEWPEHTNIEPSEEEGTAYLEVVAEAFADAPTEQFDPAEWTPVTLAFDETGQPDGDDERELAFQIETIEALQEGEPVVTYNAGDEGPDSSVVFVEGAFGTHSGANGPIRSLGGPTGHSTCYLGPAASDLTGLRFVGSPTVVDDNTATVSVAGERFGEIELGATGSSGVEYSV